MNGTNWARGLKAALVSFGLLLALWAAVAVVNSNHIGGASTDPTATPTTTVTAAPKGLDENKIANAFAKEFKSQGFKPGDVRIGQVDWSQNPVDHRGGAFGTQIRTQQELTQFLNGNSAESRAARQHVLAAVPGAERQRVLDGANYVPIQYTVNVQYGGNTYWRGNTLVRGGQDVAQAGDVFWVFVGSDYKIYWDASVRADCSNPGLSKPPTPVHNTPTCKELGTCPTPGCKERGDCPPTPKCPNGQPIPSNGLCPKTGNFNGGGVPQGQVTEGPKPPVAVQTSVPGGGGVVDNPTNSPGSETGGQAGGGATSPSPGPRATNSPEGGDTSGNNTNDGSAGGAP